MARAAFTKIHQRQKLAREAARLGANSPIDQIRRAVFGPVKVRDNARTKIMLLFDVYLEKTNDDAARGSVGAMRQITWLTSFLAEKSVLHAPEAEDPEVVASRQRLARDKSLSDLAQIEAARICIAILPDFQRAYGQAQPEIGPVRAIVPSEWSSEVAGLRLRFERAAARRAAAARRREAGESEVGYCKPPERTRWKPGQSGNPSGRARAADDVWVAHRRAAMKIIRVTTDGQSSKATAIAVAVRQLFSEAMKGSSGAHQQVKKLLILLDELNLLSPPPKVRRRAPRMTQAERAGVTAQRGWAWKSLLPAVKARMLEEYAHAYGAIPAFETRLERFLAERSCLPAPRARIRARSRAPGSGDTAPTPHPPLPISPPGVRTRTPAGGSSDV